MMFRVRMIIVYLVFICVAILPSITSAHEGDGVVESGESSDEELRKADSDNT